MELGLGWLRAEAQVYNYNYNTIDLCSSFQNNVRSWIAKMGWGSDGCARRRKFTIIVTIK